MALPRKEQRFIGPQGEAHSLKNTFEIQLYDKWITALPFATRDQLTKFSAMLKDNENVFNAIVS